jgi:hypothetical protein
MSNRGARPVAAAEQREAAFGCAAVVKSGTAVRQAHRAFRIHDCFAVERSLAGSAAATKGAPQSGISPSRAFKKGAAGCKGMEWTTDVFADSVSVTQ